MENTEKKENQIVTLDSINVREYLEFQKFKEKQLNLVKENPFIEITDNKTFELAKKSRTAFVSSRTDLDDQEKLIASKIKNFRNEVKDCIQELKDITLPSEEKQQKEVRRYEAEKQAEKEAKEKAEAERVEKIKNTINSIVDQIKTKISSLKFIDLEAFESIDFQNFLNTDVEQFEEFELEFASKIKDVKILFDAKKQSLVELENQRLEKERIAKENAELEAKKKAFELEQQKARQEAEQKAKEEAEKLEAQQRAIREQQEKANAELEAEKAKIEAEKAKLEAEQKAREEAEQKAKEETERVEREAKEKLEREAKEKAEKERIEALKPEKEKAIDFFNSLSLKLNISDIEKEIKNSEIMLEIVHFFEDVILLKEQTIEKINNL